MITGQLPIPNSAAHLTKMEREVLTKLGWKDGDPVPADLAEKFAAAQAMVAGAAAKPNELPVPPSQAPLPPIGDVLKQLDELPAAQQQQLRAAIDEAARQAAELRANPPIAGADPSVNAALQAARQQRLEVVDDRQAAAPPSAAMPDATEVPAGQMSRTGLVDRTNCQHCGWQLDQPDDVEANETDKLVFLQSMLGGRFSKTYPLFGDRLQLTFQALTTQESDLCYQQLGYAVRYDEVVSREQYLAALQVYRMALSLQSIESTIGNTPTLSRPVSYELWAKAAEPEGGWKDPQGRPQTGLPAYLEYVNQTFLQNESIRRLAGQQHARFQRLVETLEAHADDENFYKGAAPPS